MISNSKLPLILHIDAYAANQVPEPDTEMQRDPDWVKYRIEGSDDQLRFAKQSGAALAQLKECASLKELARTLKTDRDLDYFWLDLFIGVRLQYGTKAGAAWTPRDIWARALEPWDPWVK